MEVICYEKKGFIGMTKRFGFTLGATHVDMLQTKRSGFTLAEVLITLGIIGVVAAMTIPTLIANTNGAKFRSQFKKSISTLNQAGLMSQAQYDFDYAGASACAGSTSAVATAERPDTVMTFCSIFNGTLTGQTYLGPVSGIKRAGTNAQGVSTADTAYTIQNTGDAQGTPKPILDTYTNYLAYSLADGSIIAFNNAAKTPACELAIGQTMNRAWINSHQQCLGFIDVNGTTLPNKQVTCSAVPVATAGNQVGAVDKASTLVESPCIVKNDAKHMTDVFPIVFHDATVEPASDAAKYVLTSSK